MRHVHTIKKTHGETAPRHVIFADATLTLCKGIPGKTPPRFVNGPVSTFTTDDRDGRLQQRRLQPMNAGEWLLWLGKKCRANSSHWLIGRAIYQQLAALGFFQLIDGNNWQMQAPAESPGTHKRRKEWAGFVVVEEKCTIIVVRKVGGGVLHIVDANNYAADLTPDWTNDPEQNVCILAKWWDAWVDWIRRANAGSVKYTIGAQALAFFKGQHLHHPVCVHCHEQALKLEEGALYGGRCEAFRIGRLPGWVYHLDAHSLYGWCASVCNVPVQLTHYAEGAEARALRDNPGCVADVTVEMEDPAIPYRLPDRELTIWPVGRFRTVLCGPELALAEQWILETHAAAVYRLEPALESFARACWEWRKTEAKEGNFTVAKQLKAFSQVLYGKFAQRFRGWRYSPGEEPPAPWSLWWELDKEKQTPVAWRAIAGRVERHVDGGFVDQACPIISAWICSVARRRLWDLMVAAGRRNVYYCDTDSLFVSEEGAERLKELAGTIGPELGQLRVEGRYDDVEIRGWKHYVAGGRLACAGFSHKARKGWASPDGPPRIEPISSSCRERRPPEAFAAADHVTVGKDYRHGQVLSDGRIVPFRVG